LDRDRLPAQVSLAALLNNLGELFLLAHGDPRLNRYLELMEINHMLPHEVEYLSLGESLEALGYALAQQWHLPEMVREAMCARNAQYPRTLGVMLATQIARHAFAGWQHPTRITDLRLTADLLTLDLPALTGRINAVIQGFNDSAAKYSLKPLRLLPVDDQHAGAAPSVAFCLAPRRDEVATCLNDFAAPQPPASRDALLTQLVRTLHHGLGLNRVVFAHYHPRLQTLTAEFFMGTDFEPLFNRFRLAVTAHDISHDLLAAPTSIWLNPETAPDLLPRFPPSVLELTGINQCFIASLWAGDQVIGVVYADRRCASCQLDALSYQLFTELVTAAGNCLVRLNS
jgi:hypothetical protein